MTEFSISAIPGPSTYAAPFGLASLSTMPKGEALTGC